MISLRKMCRQRFCYSLLFYLIGATLCWSQANSDLPTTTNDSTFFEERKEVIVFKGANDSTLIDQKEFRDSEVQKLKADPELNYSEAPTVAESLWDRFLSLLNYLFRSLFEKATLTNLGRTLMYAVGLIALIIIIMALLKVNAFRVFYRNTDQGKFQYHVFHENIHEMNFDELIKDAVAKQDFRMATRLIFLYALKLLSEKHLILWHPGKTNHDYVEEVKENELKNGFSELSYYFDRAWYGNFHLSQDHYQKVYRLFENWKEKIV
jgi:hypothetical protein